MTITTQDVRRKAAELTAEGAPFALREFSVDGIASGDSPMHPRTLLCSCCRRGGRTVRNVLGLRRTTPELPRVLRAGRRARLRAGRRYGIGRGDRIAIAMRNSADDDRLCCRRIVRRDPGAAQQARERARNSCTGCTTAARARAGLRQCAPCAARDGAAPCDLILASGPAEVALAGVTTLSSLVEQGAARSSRRPPWTPRISR